MFRPRSRSVLLGSALAVSAALSALTGCTSDDDKVEVAATPVAATEVASATEETVIATPLETTEAEPQLIPADAPFTCPPVEGSSLQRREFPESGLTMCIDVAKQYRAKVVTNLGEFVIAFDAIKAPKTVNNFVTLARYRYFDGIGFHRVVPGFVIQGGDPDGNGTGGPGYAFEDELPGPAEYEIGSLAMANSGPDTNGSQFFVITGDNGAALPPSYSLFGKVVEGMDTIQAISALGIGDGPPSSPVTMTSVTIEESAG